MPVRLPDYLREEDEKVRQKILARVRYGNEEEANSHWAAEEKKRCRICGAPESRLEYFDGAQETNGEKRNTNKGHSRCEGTQGGGEVAK